MEPKNHPFVQKNRQKETCSPLCVCSCPSIPKKLLILAADQTPISSGCLVRWQNVLLCTTLLHYVYQMSSPALRYMTSKRPPPRKKLKHRKEYQSRTNAGGSAWDNPPCEQSPKPIDCLFYQNGQTCAYHIYIYIGFTIALLKPGSTTRFTKGVGRVSCKVSGEPCFCPPRSAWDAPRGLEADHHLGETPHGTLHLSSPFAPLSVFKDFRGWRVVERPIKGNKLGLF